MAIKDFWTTQGQNLFWFVCQLIILIICIWFIQYTYHGEILPDEVVEGTFSQTVCIVNNKNLAENPTEKTFRPDLLISYDVNGKDFQRWVSANGLDQSFKPDRVSQLNQLNRYKVGSTYPCWYNPSAPQVVVLVIKEEWFPTFPLFFPVVIALVMLYYLLRSIFIFVTTWRNKQE